MKESPNSIVTQEQLDQLMMETVSYRFGRDNKDIFSAATCRSFLPNGLQVAYGQSMYSDLGSYDQAFSEKSALERCEQAARNKLWELEGYRLAQELKPV